MLAAQSVHAAEPVDALYFPAKQAIHATPFGPEYPVLQTQLCTPVLAAGEFVYEGQSEQVLIAVAPKVVEYVVAAQFMQVPTPVAPSVAEYLPATQSKQLLAPGAEYLPASQFMQVPTPVVKPL